MKEGEVECHPNPNLNSNPNPNKKTNAYPYSKPTLTLTQVECHVDGKLVKLVGTGEYFGERALLRDEPRAADVLARTNPSAQPRP